MKITIGHLYPDMLNLYGDKGNIATLKYRLQARDIEAEVKEFDIDDDIDFSSLDIVYIGGGGEREQRVVCEKLVSMKDALISYAEDNGVILAVCSGLEILGKYYTTEEETIEGVGLLDIFTEYNKDKAVGNIILTSDLVGTIVGFENHNGRVHTSSAMPLGRIEMGIGRNGGINEGVIYKNTIATYLHGPLLPKNPRLADYIITKALAKKGYDKELMPIDDELETKAHEYIIGRFLII